MGDEHNKQLYGDFGVGLGFMIICIAFMEYIPYKPIVRLPFFLFLEHLAFTAYFELLQKKY